MRQTQRDPSYTESPRQRKEHMVEEKGAPLNFFEVRRRVVNECANHVRKLRGRREQTGPLERREK